MKTLLLALIPLLFVTAPVHAEQKKIEITIDEDGDVEARKVDQKEEAKKEESKDADKNGKEDFRFAPDFCDFEITFPEAPAVARKCVSEDQCFDVQSYTMVYDLQTTVDVTATCDPSTPENYKRYSDQVLKAALYGMIDNRNLKTHTLNFKQLETVKNATLTGEGITGSQEKIYSGQLWIGPNSVFTIQAELVGGAHEAADTSFGTILSSIKVKEGKQLPRPKKSATVPKQNNQ